MGMSWTTAFQESSCVSVAIESTMCVVQYFHTYNIYTKQTPTWVLTKPLQRLHMSIQNIADLLKLKIQPKFLDCDYSNVINRKKETLENEIRKQHLIFFW